MTALDFRWAAALMERRRARYEQYSPRFWRPARDATDAHAKFMMSVAARDGAVARRSEHGFVLTYPHGGRCFVDDFAVEADDQWHAEGRCLLLAAWAVAESTEQSIMRVVTARQDAPKRTMLIDLGLKVTARWWVKELEPARSPPAFGPINVSGTDALLVPAPPVYDPGGPVCLLGDLDAAQAARVSAAAAEVGAVLVVIQRDRSPDEAPAAEPELERAGFHNPSEFFEGEPTQRN
jgi:hypothetical protein